MLTYKDVDTRYPVDRRVFHCDKTGHQNGTQGRRIAGMEYARLGFWGYWGWHWGCSIDQHEANKQYRGGKAQRESSG